MFHFMKKLGRKGFTMAEMLTVVALISTLAAAARAQAVAAGPEVAGAVDAHMAAAAGSDEEDWGQYYRALDDSSAPAADPDAPAGTSDDAAEWRDYYRQLNPDAPARDANPDPDAPDPNAPAGVPASDGQDDATPDGGFPDADDTGLASNGLKILVYPSGAGKVTYSDGKYTAVPNEGYGFMAWYYEPRDYSDNMIVATLKWLRQNKDAAAANRAPLDDESIQDRAGYKYLIAIFERGFIPDPEPDAAGQDDATPDGGFPDADDTGLVSNGLKILVYPSGAGKVTYSDGKYTAVPNEGYGFMAWYYEPRDYSKKSVVEVLQWLRHNEDTAAANRAPLDDGSIQEREGYKYLIAIFERGLTPDPEPDAAGQDDATPDGGFPDADDTGLVSNGLKILVYPSGAGKVTYSDGKYTAVPNEGYGFMAWYYEPRDYSKKSVVEVLQWLRHNEDTAAANRAPLNDGSIQEREGYKYLIAIFERGFTPAIAQPDPSTPAHTHSWGPTTYEWSKNYKKCTAMSTCQTCGAVDKVKADKVTKTEKAATCTKAGKTTYKAVFKKKKLKYKTVEIPALGHDWGDWEVTTAPTCTQAGEEMRTCRRKGCGATENRDVPATGEHIPAAPVRENETAATCQAAGSYESVVYCATCKAELSREKKTTEKLTTHTPGDAVIENEVKATCKAGGSYDSVVYCTVCEAELIREKKTTEKLTTHTPGDAVVENEVKATCKAGGSYDSVVYCTVCQAELSREKKTTEKLTTHTPGDAVVENEVKATCKAGGSYDSVVYCTVCEAELSREKKTTEKLTTHTPGDAVIENEVKATCKAGGSYDSVVYCTVCEAELIREKKTTEKLTTHTPGDAVVENEVKATCKAGGSYDSVVYCTVCQAELSRETIQTEKLAHTEVAIPAVPATCTESGKTAGVKCSVCDTILTPQQDTEPLGHTGGEATCKAKAVCTRCKQPYGDYGPHQYELVEPGHAADCENPGSTALYRCSVCDEAEIGGDIIEPLGHEYKDGFCKRCGKKEPGIVEEEEPMTEP